MSPATKSGKTEPRSSQERWAHPGTFGVGVLWVLWCISGPKIVVPVTVGGECVHYTAIYRAVESLPLVEVCCRGRCSVTLRA
jgi:hypothetical protein